MTEGYFDPEACDIDDFARQVSRQTDPASLRFASDVIHEVPVYDAARLELAGPERRALMAEWARVMLREAGVVVLRGAVTDHAALDRATEIFEAIIARERAQGRASADHFAKGTNDRVWNSLQKLCLADPVCFAACFGAPALDAVCEAWLGPGYQMTAQVNLVHPGGAAQEAHRDYHLGFMTPEVVARYPAHVHDLSPVLTLQGAVAHCDMPVESGPTKLLPFSQSYRPGYVAWRRPEFRAYFEEHCVQLPLAKGDALFFNPALFHAAGANRTTDIHRMANLLQISSAMGLPLESVDRRAMCKALYPVLCQMAAGPARDAAIAACGDGYSFSTNLDTDPPVGGLAPETQAALTHRALAERMSRAEYEAALDAQAARRRA